MHAVALQCAIDKHQEDAKHPSEDLREALEYARSHARPYDPAAWRPPSSPHGGWAPFQPKPIHPHAAPRSKRGRVAEEARAILLSGMQVHQVRVAATPRDYAAHGRTRSRSPCLRRAPPRPRGTLIGACARARGCHRSPRAWG